MSIEWLSLAGTPHEESCVIVTDKKPYMDDMRAECKRYIEMLKKRFPVPFTPDEDGVTLLRLFVRAYPHEFGTYLQVEVGFNDEDEEAGDWAYFIESNEPAYWTDTEVFTSMEKATDKENEL